MISYQRDNAFDFKHFVRMSNQIHSKSFLTIKKGGLNDKNNQDLRDGPQDNEQKLSLIHI